MSLPAFPASSRGRLQSRLNPIGCGVLSRPALPLSDLDHGRPNCRVVLLGHGNTPYFKASRFVLSRFGKTPHFPPPGVRGLRFLERQPIPLTSHSATTWMSGPRQKNASRQKARAPLRFNRNEALDGMESNRSPCALRRQTQKMPAAKRASIPDTQMPRLTMARYCWI